MFIDGLLQPYFVKWLAWKNGPVSRAWRVQSILRDAFVKGPPKLSQALAYNVHAEPELVKKEMGVLMSQHLDNVSCKNAPGTDDEGLD